MTMLMKIVLALAGGTVLSLIFGYFVAYWREMGRESTKNLEDSRWFALFDHLLKMKKEQLKREHSRASQNMGPQKRSERGHDKRKTPHSWENHPELQRLLLKFDEFYPSLYRYFENLSKEGRNLIELEAKELGQRLKTRVTTQYMADRIQELLELRAFDSFATHELGPESIRELWMSFSTAQLYLDDARLGSASVSARLREQGHSEGEVYQAIEAQVFLVKGGTKQAIFKRFWKMHKKEAFKRSEFLQALPLQKRAKLALKWSQSRGGLSPEQLRAQVHQTVQDLQEAFKSFDSQEQKSQKSQHKSKQQRQDSKDSNKRAKRPESVSSELDWAYQKLEMDATGDFSKIKKQFKKMAMKYHPDRLAREGLSEMEQKKHHEYFVEVQRAYQILEKRFSQKAA